jgi:hypothetical protein
MTGTTLPYGLAAVALMASMLGLGPGHAQQPVHLTDAPADAETLACTTVVVVSDDEAEAEKAFAETDAFLIGEARRLDIGRVGVPFVSGYSPSQTEEFPLSYDYCMPIDSRSRAIVALNLTIRELSGRTVRVGFCPQADAARCRQEVERLFERRSAGAERGTAAQPAEGEASPAQSLPPRSIRVAPWHRPDGPRTTREMVAAIQALHPASIRPVPQESGENSTAALIDKEPRPLGSFSLQEPAAAMAPPASEPVTGFVFSID